MQIVNREKKSKGWNPKQGKKKGNNNNKENTTAAASFSFFVVDVSPFFSSPFTQVVFCVCVCSIYTKLSFPCSRGYKSLVCVYYVSLMFRLQEKRDRERERTTKPAELCVVVWCVSFVIAVFNAKNWRNHRRLSKVSKLINRLHRGGGC